MSFEANEFSSPQGPHPTSAEAGPVTAVSCHPTCLPGYGPITAISCVHCHDPHADPRATPYPAATYPPPPNGYLTPPGAHPLPVPGTVSPQLYAAVHAVAQTVVQMALQMMAPQVRGVPPLGGSPSPVHPTAWSPQMSSAAPGAVYGYSPYTG